jgi:hypothetical protein
VYENQYWSLSTSRVLGSENIENIEIRRTISDVARDIHARVRVHGMQGSVDGVRLRHGNDAAKGCYLFGYVWGHAVREANCADGNKRYGSGNDDVEMTMHGLPPENCQS